VLPLGFDVFGYDETEQSREGKAARVRQVLQFELELAGQPELNQGFIGKVSELLRHKWDINGTTINTTALSNQNDGLLSTSSVEGSSKGWSV
jgi:hypothetical protein